jgi:L-alanine-DL-glutamate epimerase-like enolase superfamily enzyme
MRIERVEVWEVALPFRFSFGHALATRASTRNLVVAVHLAGGAVGYGEGVPRDYVTGETPAGALARVRDDYVPALVGFAIEPKDVAGGVSALRDDLHRGQEPPGAAWCAVETALLDAMGQALARPVSTFLGGVVRPVVKYSGVVPFGHGLGLLAMLGLCRVVKAESVKLKVGQGADTDVQTVRLARRMLGPGVDLRVDVNCGWTADETLRMAERLRPYRVRAYEQPVPADDLEGMKRLTTELPEDVIVDEALCSREDAERLIAERACNMFNVRVSKCGGPLTSLEIARLAQHAGLECQLGTQVGETGILTAAGRLVATVAPVPFRYLEGAGYRILLKHDLTREWLRVGRHGRASALDGPGIGVHVRRGRLTEMAVQRAVRDVGRSDTPGFASVAEA